MRPTASSILVLALASCLSMPACVSAGTPRESQAAAPPPPPVGFHGPKKTIAVAKFDAHGAFLARYGSWDVGGGLSAQLSSALEKSGRFVVIERPDLSYVLAEQALAANGLTTAATSPQSGRLLGAQLLVRGSVTEFDESTGGGGFSLGGVTPRGLGGAIAPRMRRGHVAIDVRLIDTTTGRIVATQTVQKSINRMGIALTANKANAAFSGDAFKKTALGSATRDAIQDAVTFIAQSLEDVPWQAVVAKVSNGKVYMNAGANSNIRAGQTLAVYREVDRIVDPITQEVLGVEEQQIGVVRVDRAAARFSTASFAGTVEPRVGDVLRLGPSTANSLHSGLR